MATRLSDVVWQVGGDYMESTSLHGYRYLTEKGRHWFERLLWLVVHAAAGWWCAGYIVAVYQDYLDTPTATSVESITYPTWHVPFPAATICSINRISKEAVRQLARNLSEISDVDEARLRELLPYLGRLYDDDLTGRDKVDELHQLLTANGTTYDVRQLMRALTPSCDRMLSRCRWKGHVRPCRRLFRTRMTEDGHCCLFNYHRPSDKFGKVRAGAVNHSYELPTVDSPGHHMGLSVVLDPMTEDYAYPIIPMYGIKMGVFKPRDYPDQSSGGLSVKLVGVGRELFVRLSASTVVASDRVRSFKPELRRCLFDDELHEAFGGSYSHSECLVSCRLRSIKTLCNCLPFYLPSRGKTRPCNLMDIGCLARYKEKWHTQRPPKGVPGVDAEREVSIECPQCLPSCSETAYYLRAYSVAIVSNTENVEPLLSDLQLANHTVIHLFFGSSDSLLLKQDVLFYWYDLLSNFGGICGLFVGASLISVAEVLYFFTVRLVLAATRPVTESEPPSQPQLGPQRETPRRRALVGSKSQLYWTEIHHLF